ncbi:hypothetical protein ACIHCQ_35295 [Streptomyces sp. NPDC052236]|uniref:hypothetical protein n=1 Tax=Streptomyces sp. NPDC052236 TaxID=3365686 RepID=UPI0037CD1531
MPLDYRAFREHVRHAYENYAVERLGDRQAAVEAVDAALHDLAVIWCEALRSARPAALAWHLLLRAVSAHVSVSGHCLPGGAASDAELLHHRLDLPLEEIADLMGTDAFVVQGLLSAGGALQVSRGGLGVCAGCPRGGEQRSL